MGQTCFFHGSKQFDMPVSAEQRQFPSQDPAGCGILWPCRWPHLRKPVTIGLEIHKKLRLARRPPPRQTGLEFVETDASQANRSPKRTAGVETPGNLMDAVPGRTRIASHGREMHEVRHLDRTASVGEGNDPSVSAAHSHVAT